MEKMLVVVFDNETKAYEGSRILNELDAEGGVTVHAASVIGRNADGALMVKKVEGGFPLRTVEGTAIGGLIGLLGGPVGFGIGAVAGSVAGATSDIFRDVVDEDFLSEVSAKLTPGKFAVLADLSEEWVTPLDTKMEGLGGVVFRTAKQNFEDSRLDKVVRDLKVEIDDLQAEQKKAASSRKAKLQAKIDGLNAKLKNKQEQGKQRLDQRMSDDDVKIKSLKEKQANAVGDAKSSLKARMVEIRKDYNEAARSLKSLEAAHLDKVAKGLQTKAVKLRKG
ncbi:MAG TPA: DUF1269 domain-containing protein [Methanomassiliicoccales archaeon]|nr:DUF1269 domain-containing protein [Methanomassiliicoccales archaeon]